MPNKIKIVPCGGSNEFFGLVAREAAVKVVNELCPYATEMVCFAYIVTAGPEIREEMNGGYCLAIDGCPKLCASKNIEKIAGVVPKSFQTMDIFNEYGGVKSGTATTLGEEGRKMVDMLAERVSSAVKEMVQESV